MPNPNDMSTWDEIGCQHSHGGHASRQATVHLGGPTAYADLTPIPERFTRDLHLDVWAYEHYMNLPPGYCPGRDVVSETIVQLGVWEPVETTVLLLCFERFDATVPDPWFLDMGCQVGWFSALAASYGMNTWGFDADPDCAALAFRNIARHTEDTEGQHHDVSILRLGADAGPDFNNAAFADSRIVVKIDVEGAEPEAVAELAPVMDLVDFMLIEISPVFHNRYLDLTLDLIEQGFEPYEMPPKHRTPYVINKLEDLRPWHLDGDAIKQIPTWHQKNVLFARGGL